MKRFSLRTPALWKEHSQFIMVEITLLLATFAGCIHFSLSYGIEFIWSFLGVIPAIGLLLATFIGIRILDIRQDDEYIPRNELATFFPFVSRRLSQAQMGEPRGEDLAHPEKMISLISLTHFEEFFSFLQHCTEIKPESGREALFRGLNDIHERLQSARNYCENHIRCIKASPEDFAGCVLPYMLSLGRINQDIALVRKVIEMLPRETLGSLQESILATFRRRQFAPQKYYQGSDRTSSAQAASIGKNLSQDLDFVSQDALPGTS